MIRAEVFGRTLPANGAMEHAAQRHSVHAAAVDAKPDNAARELVHHHENPVSSQSGGFASEQITTPQTVLSCGRETSARMGLLNPIPVDSARSGYGAPHSLSISTPKATAICSAMRGQPHPELRRFMATTASMSSWFGPFGPGRSLSWGENSRRYLRFLNRREDGARWRASERWRNEGYVPG